MTRVLVTGATGLLGGALARGLARRGHAVLATGRRAPPPGLAGLDYRPCELTEAAAVRALLNPSDTAGAAFGAVIHAAARLRDAHGAAAPFERDNVLATANVVDAAKAVPLVVYCSTISVYSGNGPFTEDSPAAATDPYGATKRRGEELCLARPGEDRAAVALRLGGLHGHPRRDGVVHRFFAAARAGTPISVEEPDTVVTLTFIDDVLAVVERVLATPSPPGGVFNVATAEAISLRALAEAIRSCVGSASPILASPAGPRRNRVLDTSRLRQRFGHEPLPLAEHLKRCSIEA